MSSRTALTFDVKALNPEEVNEGTLGDLQDYTKHRPDEIRCAKCRVFWFGLEPLSHFI